jgi:hypothetical protein
MNNARNNQVGIYNDTDNRWRVWWNQDDFDIRHDNNKLIVHADQDGSTYLYHNAGWKIRTVSNWAEINGWQLNFTHGVALNLLTVEWKEFIRKTTDRWGFRIGADDVMVIGDGESPDTVSNNANMESEQTYITSDNTIHFYSDQQSWFNAANRVRMNGSRIDDVTCIGNCF